jgi:predicted solute-binding protein
MLGSVRLGAVGYLNARPLVYGLDRQPRFTVRYDVPSVCASLLHEGGIDVGLIPSIEYLRGGPYRVVPDLAIASRGRVASVTLFTKKPVADVRSIALDTSSRTSVALVRVLCARLFRIQPALESRGPDLDDMLQRCDAALIIGDKALFLDPAGIGSGVPAGPSARGAQPIHKIDLGDAWLELTGLPFVFAFWAGRPEALTRADVRLLREARDQGAARPEELARAYLADTPEWQALGAQYLRDNIKYHLRDDERAGLDLFYRYAAEAGVVARARPLEFYDV